MTTVAPGVRRKRHSISGSFARLILAVVFLFPILLMFMSSLKPTQQLLSDTRSWRAFVPVGQLSFDNYRGIFKRAPAGRFLFNSFFVSTLTVALGLLVNSLAGFSLARLRWRGQKLVLTLVIATLIVPFEVIAIPLLFVVNKLPWLHFSAEIGVEQGWLNSYRVQILPFVANAFSIFLFTQHFKSLPVELDEAALVDGASWWYIYSRLIVPLSGQCLPRSRFSRSSQLGTSISGQKW
jgi:multiple sugar transport system permease protein